MRTKRTILNFITDFLPQILIAFLGIYRSKLFLDFLGEEQLGLYQLYAQVIAYLVLIEGGVGSAILFQLYTPLVEQNQKRVNVIMSTARFLFRVIGIAILIVGCLIALNLGLLVSAKTVEFGYIQITFLLYLVGQTVIYFTLPQRMLFDADQKRYIPNLIFQTTTLIKSIVEIVIVFMGGKLFEIVLSLLITNLIANFILIIVCKKCYPKIKYHEKRDYSVMKDVKHLFVNTIGNLIVNNTDIFIIMKVLGLPSVVIYTTYNYIVDSLRQMLDKITGATLSSVANLLVSDKEKGYRIFLEFNAFCFYIANLIGVPLLFALNPFIQIWYGGKITTTILLAGLFSISLYYQIVRTPLKVYTLASGMFEKVKKYVILECIINLSLSLILVHFVGIAGVLIGTVVAFAIADYVPKSLVVHRELLNEDTKKYHISNMKYLLITIVSIIIFGVLPIYQYQTIWMWLLVSALIFIINFVIVTGYFYFNHELSFIERFDLKRFIKRGQKNG